jgi:tetratricopeptide (TPR) repeat protein
MENKFPGKSYIEKIAELLMEEGDFETAKALKQQAEVHQSREMTEEELELYEINKSNVRKAIGFGDFERAVDFQGVALGLAQRAFGAEHMETLKDMCELGECHFRNGAYKEAQDLYYRTLRVSSTKFGALHPFSNRVKKNIRKCADAVRRSNGLSNLEQHISKVFRMHTPTALHEKEARIERLAVIGERLVARGKMDRALKVYKSWMTLSLENTNPDDEKTTESITKYADFLVAYGDLAQAETTYKKVVQVRNRQNHMGEKTSELKVAVNDWAHCLSLMGHLQSARETQELAKKISIS